MITSRYFSETEFRRCAPACSLQDMDQDTMRLFDMARAEAGIPFVVNSAYRTKEHELAKGRSGNSAHTRGKAMDIRCSASANRLKIVRALLSVGFRRIGIGANFIHADNDATLPQGVLWHYYNSNED